MPLKTRSGLTCDLDASGEVFVVLSEGRRVRVGLAVRPCETSFLGKTIVRTSADADAAAVLTRDEAFDAASALLRGASSLGETPAAEVPGSTVARVDACADLRRWRVYTRAALAVSAFLALVIIALLVNRRGDPWPRSSNPRNPNACRATPAARPSSTCPRR